MTRFSTIPEAIAFYSQKNPDKLCLADGETELTYARFFRAVRGFASFLVENGCKTGDRVLLQAEQSVQFAVAEFGAQFAGCVCVPLDSSAPDKRISEVAKQTGASVLLLREPSAAFPAALSIRDTLSFGKAHPVDDNAGIDPGALSEILFTTGTTGASKGVMHTFRSEAACAYNQIHSFSATEDDVWIIPMPLNHAMGLRKLHAALLSGGTAVIADGVAFAGRLFEGMDRYSATILSLVPAYLSVLLRLWSENLAKYNGRLRFVRVGSAAAPREDLLALSKVLPDVAVSICYGSTEASDCAFFNYIGAPGKQGCVGHVNENTRILLLNDEGSPIEWPDVPGRIAIEGENVMAGYYGEPELTASVLQNGRLLTGDVGYFDADGLLYLLGRADEVINSGGYKISPAEVEEAAMKLEGVADCACISAPDRTLGQIPKLAVKMKPGFVFEPEKIYRALSCALERHLLPREIVETENIPRTASGKIQRALLARQIGEDELCR